MTNEFNCGKSMDMKDIKDVKVEFKGGDLKVVPLHEKKSQWDIKFRGDQLRFFMETHSEGIVIGFNREVKATEGIPPFLAPLMPPDVKDKTVQKTLIAYLVQIKWWEKFFGITPEWKIRRWVKKQHKQIKRLEKQDEIVNKLKESIG